MFSFAARQHGSTEEPEGPHSPIEEHRLLGLREIDVYQPYVVCPLFHELFPLASHRELNRAGRNQVTSEYLARPKTSDREERL